jgi:hypothetical protein
VNLLLLGFPVLNFASREATIECWIDGGYGEFSQARTEVMLRRSNIFIVIGSKFATSSVGAKSDQDRHAKRLYPEVFDGRDWVRYAAPTELAPLLVRGAIKIYLLRRIQLCASALLEVSTAFEIKLENEPRAKRRAANAKRGTPNGHACLRKDQ